MLVTVKGPGPLNCRRISCAPLVVPVGAGVKASALGLNVTVGKDVTPVPVKFTDCGLVLAELDMDKDPVRVPVALGVKERTIGQLAPGAMIEPLPPQLLRS